MRKPSNALIVSFLLALLLFGFMISQPRAAQDEPVEGWEYRRVDGEAELTNAGRDGWEAYAAFSGKPGLATYFLKRKSIFRHPRE